MKLKFLSTLIVISIAANVMAQEEETFSFSLEECIEYALENSYEIKNATLDVQIAKRQVQETVGIGLPQVNGEVSYINNFAIQTVFLPALFFDENADPNATQGVRFGVQHTGSAGINVNQLIFDGSYLVGLQAANTYQELSRRSKEATEEEIAANVMKAYYGVLISKERLDLLKANFLRLDTLLYETNIMLENGFAEQIDADRVKLNHNNIVASMENTKRILALNYVLLKFQMAMDVKQPLLLEGSLDELSLKPFNIQQLEDSLRFNSRKDYRVAQTQLELERLDLKNNIVANYPKLNGFVGFGYNSGTDTFNEITNFSDNWFNYGNFGATLSIPIFSGMQRHNRIQIAKIDVLKAENNVEAFENNILQQVEQAKTEYNNAFNTLEAYKENMELAKRIYNVTKEKNEAGVGSNFEVVEADTDYKEAETNYYSSFYDVLVSKVDLEKALGILEY
mgnify:CR=1 FL=1